jgi:hypothetical protein
MPLLCYQFKNQIFRGNLHSLQNFILLMNDFGDRTGMAW